MKGVDSSLYMSENDVFEPKRGWLDHRIGDLRWRDPIWPGSTLNRFQAEMTLLNISTQKNLQETTERSIESQNILAETQNRLSETQNKLARYSLFLAIGEVLVGVGVMWIGYVALQLKP